MRSEQTIIEEWTRLAQGLSGEARELLRGLSAHSDAFADYFYDAMLKDPAARAVLTHEQVSARLRVSMSRWIEGCLTKWSPDGIEEMVALQSRLGAMHARVGVKIDVLLRSARRIKEAIVRQLSPQGPPDERQFEAANAAFAAIDLAIEAMAEHYSTAQQVASRTGEAYRTYASSMNMSLERERQRNALLDWESRVLQTLMVGGDAAPPTIGASPFGLWIRHKASAMFTGGDILGEVLAGMERVDDVLLPQCARVAAVPGSPRLRETLPALLAEGKKIRFLTDSMFEQLITLEHGRDTLTQLLSRRFQSTILTREIELSRSSARPFAVMLVDIDRFKAINDTHGHSAGDRVLRHVANTLIGCVRSGDFVFRHGGEEFLVLCVELDAAQAQALAEKIRAAISSEEISIGPEQRVSLTASIGLTMHDGHPDYHRLIDRADKALFEAKRAGRDRCVFAA